MLAVSKKSKSNKSRNITVLHFGNCLRFNHPVHEMWLCILGCVVEEGVKMFFLFQNLILGWISSADHVYCLESADWIKAIACHHFFTKQMQNTADLPLRHFKICEYDFSPLFFPTALSESLSWVKKEFLYFVLSETRVRCCMIIVFVL